MVVQGPSAPGSVVMVGAIWRTVMVAGRMGISKVGSRMRIVALVVRMTVDSLVDGAGPKRSSVIYEGLRRIQRARANVFRRPIV